MRKDLINSVGREIIEETPEGEKDGAKRKFGEEQDAMLSEDCEVGTEDADTAEKEKKAGKHSAISSFFGKLNKKYCVVAVSVLLLGCAVFVNFILFGGGAEKDFTDFSASLTDAGKELNDLNDMIEATETGSGGYGEAGIAADAESADSLSQDSGTLSSGSDYFAQAAIDRQRAREEALEVLSGVADSDEALEELKTDALRDISRIASDIEKEAAIETLVISKGFDDCVAVISDAGASVVVSTDGLLPNEIAQIQEIVSEQAGIAPADLKIIEKAG